MPLTYTIQQADSPSGPFTTIATDITETTYVVEDLDPETSYSFRVSAYNGEATSAYSNIATATTEEAPAVTAPGAPTIGVATAGDTEATANWTAPASNGGSAITGYQVKTYLDADDSLIDTDTVGVVLTFLSTGRTNDTAIYFKVAAINAIGTGAQSAASNVVTPAASSFSDPESITGLVAWYRADDIALADNAAVASWSDKTINAHTLTDLGAAGSDPTYKTAILNGHAIARFGASSGKGLSTGTFTLSQAFTVFIIGSTTLPGSNQVFFDGRTANVTLIRALFGNMDMNAGSEITGPATDTSFHCIVSVFNGATSKIRQDGGAGVGGNAGSANAGGITIGANFSLAQSLNGDIAEVLVYDTALSLTDINNLGDYLATFYGLSWTTAT